MGDFLTDMTFHIMMNQCHTQKKYMTLEKENRIKKKIQNKRVRQ